MVEKLKDRPNKRSRDPKPAVEPKTPTPESNPSPRDCADAPAPNPHVIDERKGNS